MKANYEAKSNEVLGLLISARHGKARPFKYIRCTNCGKVIGDTNTGFTEEEQAAGYSERCLECLLGIEHSGLGGIKLGHPPLLVPRK